MAVAVENIQAELEKARENLKGVDESIRKVIGRDPTEFRNVRVRTQNEESRVENQQNRISNRFQGRLAPRQERVRDRQENEEPPTKRIVREGPAGRPAPLVAVGNPRGFKAEDDNSYDTKELPRKVAVHSRVVTTKPEDNKTRDEVLDQQRKDTKSKERNRRMFGCLLGTLQKFRQEETLLKDKEDKRAKIEKKLDEAARHEKETIQQERRELFLERRRQQAHVRRLEWKMHRIREHDEWEARQAPLMNFIVTAAEPKLYYLPKAHNEKTEELLRNSQQILKDLLESKRQELNEELERVENQVKMRQERGDRVSEANAELEELDAELEMYSAALGDLKEDDILANNITEDFSQENETDQAME